MTLKLAKQRPFAVKVQEHQKRTRTGEVVESGLAEYAWSNGHWSKAKVLHKEHHRRKRKFMEAVLIRQNPGVFNQSSVDVRNIWRPYCRNIAKSRCHASHPYLQLVDTPMSTSSHIIWI